jgi:hypothetical protein
VVPSDVVIAPRILVLVAAGCVAVAASCDSSGQRTPSTFATPDPLSAEIAGRVHVGPGLLDGAIVRVAASSVAAESATWDGGDLATDATNAFGFYRFTNAPRQYDLSIRHDRDVVVFREVLPRYIEPSFGPDAPPRAFSAHVALVVDPPPELTHQLAFFLSGADAVGVSGDLASGLDVAIRQFAETTDQPSPIVLHVVEYDAGASLARPFAYGDVPLVVVTQQIAPVTVHLAPIVGPAPGVDASTTVTVAPPSGWSDAALSDVQIAINFGTRLASRTIATVSSGSPVTVVPVPNAFYTMRATATRGAARSDSGLQLFFPGVGPASLALPAAPRIEGLEDGVLVAAADGVREHRLVPIAPEGITVRAVTTARAVALSDLARVGAAPPPGTYTWTVRGWPSLDRPEQLGGADARVVPAFATSEPVTVTIP